MGQSSQNQLASREVLQSLRKDLGTRGSSLPFMSDDIVCYYDGDAYSGGFTSLNTTICGNGSSTDSGACCYGGNRCLKDSICFAPPDENEITGYYVAGCTDPTFKDPLCSSHCATFSSTDIVYNSTTEIWACCHANHSSPRDCSTPSNETFSAPAPSVLKALASASRTAARSSSTSSSLSTTTTSSVSLPTISDTSPSSSQTYLASAAIAGIIIGVIIIGFAILLGIICICRRRTARRRRAQAAGPPPGFVGTTAPNASYTPLDPIRNSAPNASYTPLDPIQNSARESFTTHDPTRHSVVKLKPGGGGGAYTTIDQSHDYPPVTPEEMDGAEVRHGPVEMSADSRIEMDGSRPPAHGNGDASR